jgi:iron only hydrogenase large subunit-like protein
LTVIIDFRPYIGVGCVGGGGKEDRKLNKRSNTIKTLNTNKEITPMVKNKEL